MMMHRTRLTAVIPALAALCGVASAQMPATKVVIEPARMVEAPSTIKLVATVDPFRRSMVSAEIAGLVDEMPAREGDLIEADGVICRLDNEILSYQIAEEQARLDALQSRHEELENGSRPQELKRLEALVQEASAEYDRWTFEMERVSKLFESSGSNRKEFYDTRAELLTAQRRLTAAQASYELAVEGPRSEVKEQAAFDVAAQKAVVDRLKRELDKKTIRAPFTGFVVHRVVEVGEWISGGGDVVEMIELSSVLVRVDVPEFALPYVRNGQPASVKVDALNRSFDGRIKHVIRQADKSAHTFPVDIEVPNPETLLASGMFCRATIIGGPAEQVVAVPKDAIVEKNGIPNVGILMPGSREGAVMGMLTAVTLGADAGDLIAVTSGNIAPGMPIVVRGNERLQPFPGAVEVVDRLGNPVENPLGAMGRPGAAAGHPPGGEHGPGSANGKPNP